MIRELIRKFVGDSGKSGLNLEEEFEKETREAIVYNYVGGLKIQCPVCSELMDVDTTMKCSKCRAKHQLQTVTLTPGFDGLQSQEND